MCEILTHCPPNKTGPMPFIAWEKYLLKLSVAKIVSVVMLFITIKSTKSHTILFILLDLPLLNYKNDHNIMIDNNNIKINENKWINQNKIIALSVRKPKANTFLYTDRTNEVMKQLMMTKITRPTFDKALQSARWK